MLILWNDYVMEVDIFVENLNERLLMLKLPLKNIAGKRYFYLGILLFQFKVMEIHFLYKEPNFPLIHVFL